MPHPELQQSFRQTVALAQMCVAKAAERMHAGLI